MFLLLRILLISCLISVALSVLRGIMTALVASARRSGPAPQSPAPKPNEENSIERLVRDPVCGVYIPERTAIHAGNYAYCSEECRRKHRAV